MTSVAPPWSPEKIERLGSAGKLISALEPDEKAAATAEQTAEWGQLESAMGKRFAALKPGIDAYQKAAVAKALREAVAYANSPAGRAARVREECESRCASAEYDLKNACRFGDSSCRDFASGQANICRAGCVR